MFTVIICDEHIIEDCHKKFYIYLKPFLDNEEFVFCNWNTTADSLDEAVPELKEIIRNKVEWRAIIVNDSFTWDFDSVNKRNPFNYVDSKNNNKLENIEQVITFREEEEAKIGKALTNPLTKLSVWLCGLPIETEPGICYKNWETVIENIADDKSYFAKAVEMDVEVDEIEIDRIRYKRYEQLVKTFGKEAELFNPPKQVLAMSERAKDVRRETENTVWKQHMEFDYSQFYEANLYSPKLRYLICDVAYLKGEYNEAQYFNFLTTMLLLAVNEMPSGVLRANRVYSMNVKIDAECVRELCNVYNSKLNATLQVIGKELLRLKEERGQPLDPETAEFYFETGVTIPVVVDKYFDPDDLLAEYDQIGLSGDCPVNEEAYWNGQYNEIGKRFVKYLREPRRAVKLAAKDKFHSMNKNEDERAIQLSEFQRENVMDFLNEEEHNMVSTQTTHLYNTAEYKEKMEEADKDVRESLKQRMTKKKTISVALIAALAYFFGFIPLFFDNLNSIGSFLFSLGMTGVAIGVFLLVGLITLFVFKNRIVEKFRAFNDVMQGILDEIQGSLNQFSVYLSSACNVMRDFSVLETTEAAYEKKQNILHNHGRMIREKIKEVNELFSNYIDDDVTQSQRTVQPYEYDFTKMTEYQYEMPYCGVEKTIVFMQEGIEITVPVDYLEAVTVEREELYD